MIKKCCKTCIDYFVDRDGNIICWLKKQKIKYPEEDYCSFYFPRDGKDNI